MSLETFRRAVADTEAAFTALQQQSAGADERVSAVVETVVSHLKSGDALLVPVLAGKPGAWSRAQTVRAGKSNLAMARGAWPTRQLAGCCRAWAQPMQLGN